MLGGDGMTNTNDCIEKMHKIEDFLRVLDFYSIKYQKTKKGYKIVCPFHQDKDPSLHITEKNGKTRKTQSFLF